MKQVAQTVRTVLVVDDDPEFLNKPISADRLLAEVRKAMDAHERE